MRSRASGRLAAIVTTLVLVGAVPAASAAERRSLPKPFGLGVHAYRELEVVSKWMPQSKVPWTYAYHYLSGGLDTGDSWPTWQRGAPFPLDFANEAGHNGYTPLFVVDQLLSSKGRCGDECDEAEHVLTNLNDPALMKSWFEEMRLLFRLMSQEGIPGRWGFGGRVIVVPEPHLSGYAQTAVNDPKRCFDLCTRKGDDPALLEAAVRSSGSPDVKDFDDTYSGFVLATAALRDRYAPNVLLAFHVSPSVFGDDLRYSDSPEIDAVDIGERTGSFAARAGVAGTRTDVSAYDLLATDMDAADAAYNKVTYSMDTAWWDRRNVRFPNFIRYERWIDAVARRAGRRMLIFNVPVGNQRYRSMNNTEGHYQDNRGEYLLSHVDELREHRVAALLFGSTTVGATAYFDAQRDGVTNPKPVCTKDGDPAADEPLCPERRATVPDDDGGFLREAGAAFYGGGGDDDAFPVLPVAAGAGLVVAAGAGLGVLRRRRSRAGPPDAPTAPVVSDGRFEIVRPLGEGAMKRVYLARDTLLNRDVALALLRTDEVDDSALERIRREAQALARLGDHPNVVSVYDAGYDDGHPYFVCQYVAGGSLRELLRSRGRLPVPEAAALAADVCEALRHAHAAGIIHRDVKPANIWLDASGRALVGDFGIASSVDVTKMTASGMVLGTVAYMAPEQASGEPVAASDLYAVGIVLYEMLTGSPPFTGQVIAVIRQHLHEQPPAPSLVNPAVPPDVDALVADLLAKEPDARPNAAAAADRLRAIAATDPADTLQDAVLDETMADPLSPEPPDGPPTD
jgi:protein kinase-like protein